MTAPPLSQALLCTTVQFVKLETASASRTAPPSRAALPARTLRTKAITAE